MGQMQSLNDSFPIPQVFTDIVKRKQGWMLITSPKKNNLRSIIHDCFKTASDAKVYIISFNKWEVPGATHLSLPMTDVYFFYRDLPPSIFVFDDIDDAQFVNHSIRMAEKGHLVLFAYTAPRMMTWLNSLDQYFNAEEKKSFMLRLQDVAQLFLGVCDVNGINAKEYAFEMLLSSPELKTLLARNEVENIEKLLQAATNVVGVHSLNQSLVQLLIKRKIDIKNAFDVSQNPAELDLLLKKMGV